MKLMINLSVMIGLFFCQIALGQANTLIGTRLAKKSTMFYFDVDKPTTLSIEARWIFGNTRNHKVASYLMCDTNILYTVQGATSAVNYVQTPTIKLDIAPGHHLIRITMHASGGKAYVKSPYIILNY